MCDHDDDLDYLPSRLAALDFKRIHVLAWRDLDDPSAGGSEVHLDHILTEWTELGIRVRVRTSVVGGAPSHVRRNGYVVSRRGGRMSVYPRSILAELAGSRRGGPDFVLEVWNGIPWLTPLWSGRPHAALLHHVHTPMWRASVGPALARIGCVAETMLAPPIYRNVRILTPSESAKAEIVQEMRLDERQVDVVPPGVDARFRRVCAKSAGPLVLSVGRLVPAKRVDMVIRAVAEVRAKVPGARLTIVGDGPEESALQRLAADLGGASWVRFAGRVTDRQLVRLYGAGWLLASASVTEGWGMTITEAARCGTPSVVVDSVGLRDAVVSGLTGLVVPEHALVTAIGHVLSDHAARERLAGAACRRALSLTWRRTSHRILDRLLDVVAQRARYR